MAKNLPKSIKRFGSRYGRRVRIRYGQIENIQKTAKMCPYCDYKKVKQISVGLFLCKKCGARFTGRAYTI